MKNTELLVLGIGNILWADEGFGVRCIEALNAAYQFDSNVTLMDGGTQGLYLLPYVEDARRLIVFDAVDYGKAPGTLVVATDDEVPRIVERADVTRVEPPALQCRPRLLGRVQIPAGD